MAAALNQRLRHGLAPDLDRHIVENRLVDRGFERIADIQRGNTHACFIVNGRKTGGRPLAWIKIVRLVSSIVHAM